MKYWQGLPRWLSRKESTCSSVDSGDSGLIPGSGRSPGGGHGNPLQYSCLKNPMDRGAWKATVRGLQSQTWLSDWARTQALRRDKWIGTGSHTSPLPPTHTSKKKGQEKMDPRQTVWTQSWHRVCEHNWRRHLMYLRTKGNHGLPRWLRW